MKLYLALISLIVIASPLYGLDAEEKAAVDRLVEKLGSESYRERQDASRELVTMADDGPQVLEYLQKYADHPNPEIRIRIRELVKTKPGRLKWIDPKKEKSMNSSTLAPKVLSVTFKNESKSVIRIYWLDFDGKRKAWRGLIESNKQEFCERTHQGHVWLITDKTEKPLGLYVVGDENCQIVISDATGKHVKP